MDKKAFIFTITLLLIFASYNKAIAELPEAEPDPQHPRSLWVWKADVLGSSKDRMKLFDLCQSAAIANLYVYIGNFNPKNPNSSLQMAQFLKEAHAKNLRVEALEGRPEWAFIQHHNECLDWVSSFYNTGIDGISLDVEPYLTPQWQSDKQTVCLEFLQLLKKIRASLTNHKQNMRLGVAVPSFFYEIDKGKFMEDILQYVDYIVIMDYYDNASRIIEEAEPYLKTADRMNKKIVIGVETQDLITMHQGTRRLTFFEEGWQEMENALSKVKEKAASHPSFEGFAIHCDYSYMALPKGRNSPKKERQPVDNIYHIYSAQKSMPVNIDGKLDDWDLSNPYLIDKKENVVYGASSWQGPGDLSAASFSAWDEDNIYFAFRVTDDKIVQEKTNKDMWEGDHVQVWLDTDLTGDYNEAVSSRDDYQFGFSSGNFKNIPPEVYVWVPEGISNDYKSKIQIASTKTIDGYIVEVCIPASVFGIDKFRKGDKFGISLGPSDQDDSDKPQKALMSSSPDWIWGDPTTFGVLELQ